MSGLFDNRTDGSKRREARTKKEKQAKRKTRTIAVSVVSVVAVLFIGALIVNSTYIRRNVTVLSVGDVDFTAVEVDYFYNNAQMEFQNDTTELNLGILGMPQPDFDRPMANQIRNVDTGETWADFFVETAIANMSELAKLYSAAGASGFVLTDEHQAEIDQQIESMRAEAESMGFPSLRRLLQRFYGNSINEASFRGIMEFVFLANTYSEHIRDSMEYEQDEIDSFYEQNSDSLDVISFRVMALEPQSFFEWEFETVEEFEEATEAATLDFDMLISSIIASVTSEEDFIEAARGYGEQYFDPDSTLRDAMGEMIDPTYAHWLQDSARVNGDMEMFGTPDGAVQFVMFLSRDDNSYLMTDMRQILMSKQQIFAEDFEEGEFDPEYITAVEEADMVLEERANMVLDEFIAAGATESALLDLMEHSDDWTEGGLYTGIARFFYQSQTAMAMRVVPEIENWLFDPVRQQGDHELIYTEAFGYHLIYFMGHGERFRDFIATDRKRSSDHEEWREALADLEAVRHWAFRFTEQ